MAATLQQNFGLENTGWMMSRHTFIIFGRDGGRVVVSSLDVDFVVVCGTHDFVKFERFLGKLFVMYM